MSCVISRRDTNMDISMLLVITASAMLLPAWPKLLCAVTAIKLNVRCVQPTGKQASKSEMKSTSVTVSGSTGLHFSGFARSIAVLRKARWLRMPNAMPASSLAVQAGNRIECTPVDV